MMDLQPARSSQLERDERDKVAQFEFTRDSGVPNAVKRKVLAFRSFSPSLSLSHLHTSTFTSILVRFSHLQ